MTLPNFVVIGAARSGTTSLFHNLSEHPDVYMSSKKEPHFFTLHWKEGLAYYETFFEQHGSERAVGEASMTYTYPGYEGAVDRLAKALPEARIIYMLRDPVERTYSHYLYNRFYKLDESREFREAFEADPLYREASNYPAWLRAYSQYYGADQLRVFLFEDFKRDSLSVLREIFAYLEVDTDFVPRSISTPTNASSRPRSVRLHHAYRTLSRSRARIWAERLVPHSIRPTLRNRIRGILGTQSSLPQLGTEDRAFLEEHFRPQIAELAGITGRNFSQWTSGLG